MLLIPRMGKGLAGKPNHDKLSGVLGWSIWHDLYQLRVRSTVSLQAISLGGMGWERRKRMALNPRRESTNTKPPS